MQNPETRRVILHVDIDSFYPSVEAIQNPLFRGKPLIVGADPKRRGVVVSCSYEARKFGVRSGQPISKAYRICPDAIYVRPNFPLYGKVSTRVMDLLRGFADTFEQVSIDEAFLDLTKTSSGSYETAEKVAWLIKKDLKEKEGLTCSIGIAPNKSSAKIAAEYKKPDGLTVVPPEKVKEFLSPLPVSAITGVGKKTEEFLGSINVRTISDLQKIPGKELVKYFGKTGVWLWGVAHGLEQIEVRERTIMKSLSAEHTFEKDVLQNEALAKLDELVQKLHARVIASSFEYRVVSIKIRFSHFETHSRENTLGTYTSEKGPMLKESRNLLREFQTSKKKIRLIGVSVSDLRTSSSEGLEQWIAS